MIAYTLSLDSNWDITLDSVGNIATRTEAYAIAQNAANAVRLFTKDAYFNQQKGIPHFDIELGNKGAISVPVLSARIRRAVLKIDGVIDADVSLVIKSNHLVS